LPSSVAKVHHCAFRNRRLNDLVAQTLCFWPLYGDLHGYRAFHLAHHRFPQHRS
jgi:fatty acid desaturase